MCKHEKAQLSNSSQMIFMVKAMMVYTCTKANDMKIDYDGIEDFMIAQIITNFRLRTG